MNKTVRGKKTIDVCAEPPASYLYRATEYHSAAVELRKSPNRPGHEWRGPIYFMIIHSIELALKAFFRTRFKKIQRSHDIQKLFQTCCENGIDLNSETKGDIGRVIELLVEGNSDNGFRYLMVGEEMPAEQWAIEASDNLIRTVATAVDAYLKQNSDKPTFRVHSILGKP